MKIAVPGRRQIEGDAAMLTTRFGTFGIFEAEEVLTIFVNKGEIEVIERGNLVQIRTKKNRGGADGQN